MGDNHRELVRELVNVAARLRDENDELRKENERLRADVARLSAEKHVSAAIDTTKYGED